ncbi:MAG: energy-coupled thiamine transporter ThiT [Firmicutes bacterium]|jgi:thiamine transporter|nr:energy-coupled thiamine transporter ThiT [Bacillota bacterium]
MEKRNLQIMVETAVLVGAALVLSMIRLWRLPQGGSIGIDMLPIFVLAFRRGGRVGLLGGALFGMMKLLTDPFIMHPVQVLLDYPIPFAALGVAGFFRNKMAVGVVVGALLRYLAHIISGVVFFAEYAPEGTSALIYSMVYNGTFLIPETILVGVILFVIRARKDIFEPAQ